MLAAMPRQTGITPERNDLFTVLALIEGGSTCLIKETIMLYSGCH
jgi:hypothetical protein